MYNNKREYKIKMKKNRAVSRSGIGLVPTAEQSESPNPLARTDPLARAPAASGEAGAKQLREKERERPIDANSGPAYILGSVSTSIERQYFSLSVSLSRSLLAPVHRLFLASLPLEGCA